MQGPHDELTTELKKRIKNDPYTKTYRLDVSIIDSNLVVLTGRVKSFHHKQMAQVAMQQEIESHCNDTHLFIFKNEIEVD